MAETRTHPSVDVARWAVLAACFLGLALIARSLADPFQGPKATALWALSGVALAALAVNAQITRRIPAVPWRFAAAFLAVGGAYALSLGVSGNRWSSLFGTGFRHAGVLTYLALGLLSVIAIALIRQQERTAHQMVIALAAACTASVIYGAMQALELDPYEWGGSGPDTIALLGNANYAGAISGAAFGPLVIAAVRVRRAKPVWAAGFAVLAVMAIFTSLQTGTSQALALLVASPLVPLLAWLWSREGQLREYGPRIVASLVLVGSVVVALGFSGSGPLGVIGEDKNVVNRRIFWTGTSQLIQDNVLLGVGADQFGDAYRAYRDPREAFTEPANESANGPHTVVLEMWSGGGVPALLAHGFMVLTVAMALFGGLAVVRDDKRRWWLATAGSLWLSYQLQALISLDVPPMVALHYLSGAAVVGLALHVRSEGDESPPPAMSKASAKRKNTTKAKRKVRPAPFGVPVTQGRATGFAVVASILAVTLLAASWVQTSGLRIRQRAIEQLNLEEYALAQVELERLVERNPWPFENWLLLGEAALRQGNAEEALGYLDRARLEGPGRVQPMFVQVNAYVQLDELDKAIGVSEQILELDPHIALAYIGRSRLAAMQGDEALELSLAQFAAEYTRRGEAWFYLAGLLEARGDIAGAIEAFESSSTQGAARDRAREEIARLRALQSAG